MLERITAVLERARIDGGWIDDIVALAVLKELGLDENGDPVVSEPTSSEIGHG